MRAMNRSNLYTRWVKNGWLFEFSTMLLSCGSAIALGTILAVNNKQEMPQFGILSRWGMTLNTVVSMLAIVSVFSAGAVVTSCLDQLKWLWFVRSGRPLRDFETYDEASRGILGSIMLPWKLRLTPTASLGALLVTLQLTIPPLAQQSIQSEMQRFLTPELGATLLIAINWTDSERTNSTTYTPGIRGSMLRGLFTDSSEPINYTVPSCPSGNCTFGDYNSLAVCYKVVDVTKNLTERDESKEEFPGTSSFAYIDKDHYLALDYNFLANITSATKYDNGNFSSIAFKNYSSPIADFFILYTSKPSFNYVSPSQFKDIVALEFVLNWCVPTFSTNVINGIATSTRRVNTSSHPRTDEWDMIWDARDGPFRVSKDSHGVLQDYLTTALAGELSPKEWALRNENSVEALAIGGAALGFNNTDRKTGKDGVGAVLENVATSMTNYIRSPSASQTLWRRGNVDTMRNIVIVQWGWFMAPIIFVLLSLTFFLVVYFEGKYWEKSARVPLWKSSSIAVLRALDLELRSELGPPESSGGLGNYRSGLCIRLVHGNDGWSFVRDEGPAKGQDSMALSSKDPEAGNTHGDATPTAEPDFTKLLIPPLRQMTDIETDVQSILTGSSTACESMR